MSDPRVDYVLRKAFALFGFSKARWDKFRAGFSADEASARALDSFLNDRESPLVFLTAAAGETFTVSKELPPVDKIKKKGILVYRARAESDVTKDNVASAILFSEMSKTVVDNLAGLLGGVYAATLDNERNQRGWSDLIRRDLVGKFHGFLQLLQITSGSVDGRTLLPLPPKDALSSTPSDSITINKERVHTLESTLILWTKEIRHVLAEDSEQLFGKAGAASHPEPTAEIDFWASKAANLNSITEQLRSQEVQRMLEILTQNNSTYVLPFKKLLREVESAQQEANDNSKFLNSLTPLINKLVSDTAELSVVEGLFDPIFHYILLVWKYSQFYNTPSRLVNLIKMIANSVILQSTRYINGPTIFGLINGEEAGEALDKLNRILALLASFKARFSVYKDIAEQNATGGWKVQVSAVFARLDEFKERVEDVLNFVRTIVQYQRLERVEIGGTKGKVLSQNVVNVYSEFKQAVQVFQGVKYDIMDVEERVQFELDFDRFRRVVKELDRRLAAVISVGFEDLDTMMGKLKLFDGFEGLLERQILQEELDRKFLALINQYREDLKEVQRLYNENKSKVVVAGAASEEEAPVYAGLPPVTAAIYWARSMKLRVNEPMGKLTQYFKQVREKPEDWKEIEKLHGSLNKQLEDFEKQVYELWEAESVGEAKGKLNMTLLRRIERSGLIRVNFDPAVVRLLREVRYFLYFKLLVPEAGMEMYKSADVYRQWTGQLDAVIQRYNGVLFDLLPVEEPLLEDRIAKMDATLSPGLLDIRWHTGDQKIPEFLNQAKTVVGDVAGVVEVLKSNLKKITGTISKWCQHPLLERKLKPMSPEDFDSIHKAAMGVKLLQISEDGKEIHKLLKDSSEALKVSKSSVTWKLYVDFVNGIIIEGFVSAIAVSLQYLCELLDPLIIARHEMQPLFDVKIELQGNDIIFEPPYSQGILKAGERKRLSLRSVIDGWLKDFFAIATTMQRLDTSNGDFLNELKEHFQMQCLLALVSELTDNTEGKCMEYRQTFLQHSYLWTDSIEDAFKQFLEKHAQDFVSGFSEEGVGFNDIMKLIGVDMGKRIPGVQKFDEQIMKFTQMKAQIAGLKTPVDIHWLRLNAQPVKVHLVQCAARWEEKYSTYLHEWTSSRIQSTASFIQKVSEGLKQSPTAPGADAGSEQLLYQTMTHIRDVKLAMNAIKRLFEPLREQVQLLKKHGVAVSDQEVHLLEQMPAKWDEVVRAAFDEKERILPLQNMEMLKIKKKIDAFSGEVDEFRAKFLAECPFQSGLSFDEAYAKIDVYYGKTLSMIQRAKEYNNLELLFDMQMSAYRPLKESLEDLILLKNLWDAIALVKYTFEDWNATVWDRINTDELLLRVKDLTTQVKNMPKEMRTWKLYAWLMDEVKNMATVLPLVNDLHSDTMRDRHWKQLMDVTGTSFVKGPNFCFKDLLDLQLHKFADDVSEIVDQSAKEAKIEKKLGTIKSTWSKLTLEFDRSREDCPLLMDLGPVIEVLEAHSLEMMGMISQGRFIEFCRPVVDEWSEKLRTVDSVLAVWQKVQRNWSRLEPIFMLSDDIRSQLPEDSKRFEAFDQEFKDMMIGASQLSNAVEICCQEGRLEVLKRLNETVESCEKSLNEYLESKKKAFPRFYFVANQALLDILSNGNKPKVVAQYLGDCFDGIKTLNFEKSADGKIANGLYSKDSEYVPFHDDIILEGAVESYLLNLEKHVRMQLRDILENARQSADNWEVDKPREIWLQDYCAQLALLTTQMVWTEETARAFDELEGGSETVMKDYKRVCDDRIEKLIKQVQQKLSSDLRAKIITVITIDVHARDMIEKFVAQKLTDSSSFLWQSQLRFYWQQKPQSNSLVSFTPDNLKTCVIRICDWSTIYAYEYIGNCGRLVITPLTDRCYITLTQALNLIMGGAPAGPAGTGKTETTKDLSRNLGLAVCVFNCR